MVNEIISTWREETIRQNNDFIFREGTAGFAGINNADTQQLGSLTRACLRENLLLAVISDGEYNDNRMYLKNRGNFKWLYQFVNGKK